MVRSFIVLFIIILSVTQAAAQDRLFAPGKLVQTQKQIEYPFPLLSHDSVIGQSYILVSAYANSTMEMMITSMRKNENPVNRTPQNTHYKNNLNKGNSSHSRKKNPIRIDSSLESLYNHQQNSDSLLAPLIGHRFQILKYEQPRFRGMNYNYVYALAQFLEGPKIVLFIRDTNLIGIGEQLVPAKILDEARDRWLGKYLWVNALPLVDTFPAFTRLKVLSIDATKDRHGLYAFHLQADGGDTVTTHCALQPVDTSMYAINSSIPFGELLLDQQPGYYWKTTVTPSFDFDGVALGEDSVQFFQLLHQSGIKIDHYDASLSSSGSVSRMEVLLHGNRMWGIPIDTSWASFEYGKLSHINFFIFDLAQEAMIIDSLNHRFGMPSMHVRRSGLLKQTILSWFYYSSDGTLSEIRLDKSHDDDFELPQIPGIASYPMLRATLTYEKENPKLNSLLLGLF